MPNDPIELEHLPDHFDHHRHGPELNKQVHVLESEKLTEIRNKMGMLCYIVAMTKYDNFRLLRMTYQVEVTSHYSAQDPLIIFTRDNILTFNEAEKIYNDAVLRYTYLTKALNRDIQDIELFKEPILYQLTECCLNCRHCKLVKVPFKFIPENPDHFPYDENYICRTPYEYEVKLECHNPALFHEIDRELLPHDVIDNTYEELILNDHHEDPNHLKHINNHKTLDLHPEVKADCICKFYEKSMDRHHKEYMPGDRVYKQYEIPHHVDNHGKSW